MLCRDYTHRKSCPKCGGSIKLSVLCQYSKEYFVTKEGKLSKNFRKLDLGPIDAHVAYCQNPNCEVSWNADQFMIDSNGEFLDFKYL